VNADTANQARASENRRRIIEAADQLFYVQGYNATSFSDIAREAGLPRGNFYYYFKTKDDILNSVLGHRMTVVQGWLTQCEAQGGPREQIIALLELLGRNAEDIARYGCPLGTLNSELGKQQPELQAQAAQLFRTVVDWLTGRCEALVPGTDARDCALQIVSRSQGAALLAQVYADPLILRAELDRLMGWLRER
jgi:AcrR family transcriptional regulator